MRYATVCSGIEAPTVAWHDFGWEPQWFSEIEKFPNNLLTHHYPTVPNLGDMTKLDGNEIFERSTIDLLCGGTPCQSFSVAGLRKGLDDPRGNLMLTFLHIARRKRPQWVVWENVPGVLSSNRGLDFAAFLTGLGQCGYGFAYRVLDSQFFGIPQRRRRVFVVGYLGDWRPAAAILFEQESLRGRVEKGRKTGEEITSTLTKGTGSSSLGHNVDDGGFLIANTLTNAQFKNSPDETYIPTVFQSKASARNSMNISTQAPCLDVGKSDGLAVETQYGVRRLTPIECERLMGFPDNYTLIPNPKKLAADDPRYSALGNSMAVPVVKWIGQRIKTFESCQF